MKMNKKAARFFGFVGVQVILFSCALSTFGADHPVTTSGFTFSPPTLSIPKGDSVTWSGLTGGGHTTTSDTSLWSSGSDGFSFVFSAAGTYNYHCIPHQSFGMVGTITVTNASAPTNVPPTITISSPASGKVFAAPADVTVQTTPADSDGTVTNVQFLLGASVLGNKSTQPFSMTASNLAAADYVISAIVSDNQGAKATNSVTVHVINPSAVTLSLSPAALSVSSTSSFQFSYSTDLGLNYEIEVSTDLFTWKPIATNSSAPLNPATFTDTNAPAEGAYYRVGRMPNP
jgi:plastocyanin